MSATCGSSSEGSCARACTGAHCRTGNWCGAVRVWGPQRWCRAPDDCSCWPPNWRSQHPACGHGEGALSGQIGPSSGISEAFADRKAGILGVQQRGNAVIINPTDFAIELNDVQTQALIRELDEIIRNDRYFLSPRIVVLKEILAMLRPEPARPAPLPPLRDDEPPSKGRYGRRR